jgi:hypothetical protein
MFKIKTFKIICLCVTYGREIKLYAISSGDRKSNLFQFS